MKINNNFGFVSVVSQAKNKKYAGVLMGIQTLNKVAYGLSEALPEIFNSPIVTTRNPTTSDKAPIGQTWINKSTNSYFVLTSVVNNIATWVTGNSGSGVFTTITASGNITSTAGNIAATAGSMSAGTTITAGTGITATTGNVTVTNGNVVFSAAATGISLPGPTTIRNGAGAPANGLAVNVGDIYINTTAATAATRIYVATAAGTWTNITCAA